MHRIAVTAAIFSLSVVVTSAATTGKDPASYVSKAEFDKVLSLAPPSGDQQMRIEALSKANVGVAIVRWPASPNGVGAIAHEKVDEVYYMLEGSGTITSGGTIADSKGYQSGPDSNVGYGPSAVGKTIVGGTTRQVGPGDVVVIPAGVPHAWSKVDQSVKYILVRYDPDKILKTGYENPLLKK